tara:strand:+ start:1185 stop:1808 length:624 start_codon:yes stop_codon:yes gene_type:complete
MHNASIPSDQALPTTGKLILSTILAAVVAGVLLVTVVMPAEYGMDPTGIGEATGLKRMGEIKVSLEKEAAAERVLDLANTQAQPEKMEEEAAMSSPELSQSTLSHEMQVTLAPDEGTEIKVTMKKGSKVQYSWQTDGGNASFDLHGDSRKLKINYHSYSKGSKQKIKGIFEAKFDGNHGWFWRNRTSEPMTITLKTDGVYTDIKHFK